MTSKLAPFMAAVYTAGGLLILLNRYDQIPAAFWEIISGAFKEGSKVKADRKEEVLVFQT